MGRLTVNDCLWRKVARVLDRDLPRHHDSSRSLFAVFKRSVDKGDFCGLATILDVLQHPDWIFADLVGQRDLLVIDPNMDVFTALKMMDQYDADALPILEQQQFIGVVTRQSILETLVVEHQQMVSRIKKLSGLNAASHTLLSVLAHTSVQNDLLQTGIDALSHLLEARYGAIGILDESGLLKQFVYTGINTLQAEEIGRLPEGKGLLGAVIRENISLRFDDMRKDPRSIGFPANHPSMKSLLAVPISHQGHVYGRIYLSDKMDGQAFSEQDEDLAFNFAHSLSLILDNAREMEEAKRTRQSLDYLAHFDALTQLPNRALLKDRAQQAIAHAQRNEGMIGILFLDLDNFKMVNDTIGHTVGDILLKRVAQRLTNCLRASDTVARLGGDEFIVMLPAISDTQAAAKIASKILESLAAPFDIEQHEVFVSVSIGISIYPHDSQTMDGLLANADGAMYHAKKLGKNNYQFFTGLIDQKNGLS